MKGIRTAWIVVTLLFPCVLGAAEKLTGDLAALQGEWKAWRAPNEFLICEIRGDSITLTRHEQGRSTAPWTGSVVVDDSQKPKQLAWVKLKSEGKDLPDNQCIYELHGDTWLLIGGGPARRPDHFFSGGGEGHQTLVFKRQKE